MTRALESIPVVEQDGFVIRSAEGPRDFELLARIRAEAYYEVIWLRWVFFFAGVACGNNLLFSHSLVRRVVTSYVGLRA